jgi:hypothetical protein
MLARLHVEHQIEPQHGEQKTGARRGEAVHGEFSLIGISHLHLAPIPNAGQA